MSTPSPDRQTAFRALIEDFLRSRRDKKLKEKKLDAVPVDDPLRLALIARHQASVWLSEAAFLARHIHLATHVLKATHSSAKGSNFLSESKHLLPTPLISAQGGDAEITLDAAIDNANALGVYDFLNTEHEGRRLLDYMLGHDIDLLRALNDDQNRAEQWCEAFTSVARPSMPIASHTFAKQLYWLVGDDPLQDEQYHLLAPLYASSLAHRVFQTINQQRFSDDVKAARKARWQSEDHPTGFVEYPSLAMQKLGGANPQNISQLNKERRGRNYLLGSLPPQWKSRAIQPLWHAASAFPRYGQRNEVRETIKALRVFLESSPEPTMETRNRRDAYLDALLDELVSFAREIQEGLAVGWTAKPDCALTQAEQLWLDPFRAEEDNDFNGQWQRMEWPAEVGVRFGGWLNAQLDRRLPLGEVEQREWTKELLVDETWAMGLHKLRKRLDAPTYIPVRRAS